MLFYIFLTFLLAGFVKGVIGMGLPTVAVGMLGVVMAPSIAAAVMVVPSLATNVWQALAGPHFRPALRRFGPLFAGICLGLWTVAALAPSVDDRHATAALGLILIIYVLTGRLRPTVAIVPPRMERWVSPLIGLATGALTAITGVFVMPAVPYLQRLGLDKDALVQTLGLTFLVATIALGLSVPGTLARLATSEGHWLVAALAAAVAGMRLGQAVRQRISLMTFRACFFWGMLTLGTHLLVSGLTSGPAR